MIIPEVVLIQLSSWRWAQSCLKHVGDPNKHIIEETVRQVGHLPELILCVYFTSLKTVSEAESTQLLCNTRSCWFFCKLNFIITCIKWWFKTGYVCMYSYAISKEKCSFYIAPCMKLCHVKDKDKTHPSEASWLLYVPQGLTLNNSMFSPNSALIYLVHGF